MSDDLARVIYVRWSDDGWTIHRMATEPFEGGDPMYSRSFLLSEERVEAAARGMTPLVCGSQEDEYGNDLPDKQFDELRPDWQGAFKEYARAALTAAMGGEDA